MPISEVRMTWLYATDLTVVPLPAAAFDNRYRFFRRPQELLMLPVSAEDFESDPHNSSIWKALRHLALGTLVRVPLR
jgi:hypothetical protein